VFREVVAEVPGDAGDEIAMLRIVSVRLGVGRFLCYVVECEGG
jgi:hypothetical protein